MKKNISKKISKKLFLTLDKSSSIVDSFLSLVKSNSKTKIVKLSGFGSFEYKKTPQRIGRNPNTEESYIIPVLNKLNFKPSNKIKKILN
tara:strand:+ start:18852 stop:19118 length:267 start_codon:yes stop_codon:yes gene_type:complete